MRACIVSFSSRKNGNCSQISEFIKLHYKKAAVYDFADFTINACGNCSYECFDSGSDCPFFTDKECEILDKTTRSDITYFVVPNYCDFPCSNFFIFNERSLCYFQNNKDLLTEYLQTPKKFIVVSNTDLNNFKTAFAYHTNSKPRILCLSAKKYDKLSTDGNILTSEQAKDDLLKFISE